MKDGKGTNGQPKVRGMDDTDLLGLEESIKSFGQFAIIVMNQTAKSLFPFFDSPDILAGLPGHPVTIGIGRVPSVGDIIAPKRF